MITHRVTGCIRSHGLLLALRKVEIMIFTKTRILLRVEKHEIESQGYSEMSWNNDLHQMRFGEQIRHSTGKATK